MIDKQSDDFWEVVCSKEEFEKFKNDERFLAILNLSRIVNALLFCQISALETGKTDTPSAKRQRINSFFYGSAVLYEGLRFANTLGKYFRNLESFRRGFEPLLKDKSVKKFKEAELNLMRNKFIFHFDNVVAQKALKSTESDSNIFAIGYGERLGQIYYTLADEAAIHFILNDKQSAQDAQFDQDFECHSKQLIQRITNLMTKFTEAADQLIGEVIKQMGWTFKRKNRNLGLRYKMKKYQNIILVIVAILIAYTVINPMCTVTLVVKDYSHTVSTHPDSWKGYLSLFSAKKLEKKWAVRREEGDAMVAYEFNFLFTLLHIIGILITGGIIYTLVGQIGRQRRPKADLL